MIVPILRDKPPKGLSANVKSRKEPLLSCQGLRFDYGPQTKRVRDQENTFLGTVEPFHESL
jgi:hypothetical protein